MKVCSQCGATETKKWYSGPLCLKCYGKNYCAANRDKVRQWAHTSYERHKPERLIANRKYYRQHREATKNTRIAWKAKNSDKMKQYWKQYRKDRQEVKNAADKEYAAAHKLERNQREKARRRRDLDYRLRCNLRSRLRQAIVGAQKAGSAVRDLGCTIPELKQHLTSLFQPGMTWDNWGWGLGKWNIDHIYPLSKLDLTDREQLLKACHYTNLQPLWHTDNNSKRARL